MLSTRRFSLFFKQKAAFLCPNTEGVLRDAQGNILAIYQKKDNNFTWKEQHLYGSSRLGVFSPEVKIQGTYVVDVAALQQGTRTYELTNHLGNVLSTITDKGTITSAQDYYPFGLTLASRSFTEGGSSYRYSFNGKEDDKELGTVDFGDRMYRKDLGRWLAVDMQAKNAPNWTPYRFGFNNPLIFKDPNGQWEEDGHYWTVYALGIAMGLPKVQAEYLAWKAESSDHWVHKDGTMSIRSHKSGISWGKDGGLGTWADPNLQTDWHGLTGGLQKHVNSRAKSLILSGDLRYLHLLGDSWAHSYMEEEQRVMYGRKGRNEPGYSDIARLVLGEDLTLEHAQAGPEHGQHADNISDRPKEYSSYLNDLKNIFNDDKFRYNFLVKNSDPDMGIFKYIQKNGNNKENNIFLLKSFIDLKTGAKEFSNLSQEQGNLLGGLLKQMGVKFTQSPVFGGLDNAGQTKPSLSSLKIN